jgi:hypothetical protein
MSRPQEQSNRLQGAVDSLRLSSATFLMHSIEIFHPMHLEAN